MFDTLLNSVAARFGLSADKAKQLLGLLIALIFNEKRGGAAGFVDLFRSRGLGNLIDSWTGDGANEPIEASQLEQVLGAGEIDTIASQVGLDRGIAASAMAAMLPDAFHALTEDGRVPTSLPDRFRAFMDELGDFFRGIGAGALGLGAAAVGGVARAAERAGDAIGDAAENTVDAIGDAGRATARTVDRAVDNTVATTREVARDASSGIGKLLPWLLLAGLLIAALLLFRGCNRQEATPAPTPAPAATPTTSAAAGVPAFGFENTDGRVTVNGRLASEAEKNRLLDAIRATFGADNVSGDITVDTSAAPAGWMDKLIAMLPDLKASGLKFNFDGDKLRLDTSGMSEADRFALTDRFRTAFRDGQYEITGLWDRAMAALAGLKDGFSSDDLVKALNLMNVYFATDSATITNDSMETLRAAADAIKRSSAGTRIEAGGHTDNTGDAAHNMTLSQQRAEAVVTRLKELGVADGILSAKGYGQDKPIADNGTEEGKARNRRMEFTFLN